MILAALSQPGWSQAIWTRQSSGTPNALHLVIWTGTQLVACSRYTFDMLTSPEGVIWTPREPGNTGGAGAGWNGLAWTGPGEGQLVAFSWADKRIMTSPDGITWATRVVSDTDDHNLNSAAWTGSQIVAVGLGGAVMFSGDGATWTGGSTGTNDDLNSVAWAGGLLVAVGQNGTILTSPDQGKTWAKRASGTLNDLKWILWAGGQLVVTGTKGTLLTSLDGINWTARASNTQDDINSVTWTGSQYVAAGGDPNAMLNNVILTSAQGNAWAMQSLGTTEILESIAWTGNQLVVVGQFGSVLTSPQNLTAIVPSLQKRNPLFPNADVYTVIGEKITKTHKPSFYGRVIVPPGQFESNFKPQILSSQLAP